MWLNFALCNINRPICAVRVIWLIGMFVSDNNDYYYWISNGMKSGVHFISVHFLFVCGHWCGQMWKMIWIVHGTFAGFQSPNSTHTTTIRTISVWKSLLFNQQRRWTTSEISGSGHQKAFSQKSTKKQKKRLLDGRLKMHEPNCAYTRSDPPHQTDWAWANFSSKNVAVSASRCRRCSLFSSRGRFSLRPLHNTK